MNDLIASLLLGLIEGITEFLPISSTGHLLIAEHWLGARSDLFNIAIQAGAILAVVFIYRERLLQLLLGLGERDSRDAVLKLGLAFAVTAVLGLTVKKLGVQLPESLGPIAWALLIGGVLMLWAESLAARRARILDEGIAATGDGAPVTPGISWSAAALVGAAQVMAGVFPGTSRSAAAIFAALLFGGVGRAAATEFAFLVGIPTMFAATGYELLHVLRDGGAAGEDWTGMGLAFVVSALTAFAAVKWLLGYIVTHRFTVFSWYRIVLGIALLVWVVAPPLAVAAAEPTEPAWVGQADAEAAPATGVKGAGGQAGKGTADNPETARSVATAVDTFRHLRLCDVGHQSREWLEKQGTDPNSVLNRPFNARTAPDLDAKYRHYEIESMQFAEALVARASRECDGHPTDARGGRTGCAARRPLGR